MNLLLLLEANRISEDQFMITEPDRIEVIQNLVSGKNLRTLKAGVEGQTQGVFSITSISSQKILGKYRPIVHSRRRKPEVHLHLALQRPQTVKKILQLSGMVQVKSLSFFISEKAQKSYLTSPIWKMEEMAKQLRTGMEQGKNIFIPELHPMCLHWEELQDQLCKTRFLLDRKGKRFSEIELQAPCQEMSLVIGPESGFIPKEIGRLKEWGCVPIQVSDFVLRTEIALSFALAQIHQFTQN